MGYRLKKVVDHTGSLNDDNTYYQEATMEDINDAYSNLILASEEVVRYLNVANDVSSIIEKDEMILATEENVPSEAVKYSHGAFVNLLTAADIKLPVIGIEESVSNPRVALVMSMEEKKGILTRIWEFFKNAVKKVIEWFKKFFNFILGRSNARETELKEVKEILEYTMRLREKVKNITANRVTPELANKLSKQSSLIYQLGWSKPDMVDLPKIVLDRAKGVANVFNQELALLNLVGLKKFYKLGADLSDSERLKTAIAEEIMDEMITSLNKDSKTLSSRIEYRSDPKGVSKFTSDIPIKSSLHKDYTAELAEKYISVYSVTHNATRYVRLLANHVAIDISAMDYQYDYATEQDDKHKYWHNVKDSLSLGDITQMVKAYEKSNKDYVGFVKKEYESAEAVIKDIVGKAGYVLENIDAAATDNNTAIVNSLRSLITGATVISTKVIPTIAKDLTTNMDTAFEQLKILAEFLGKKDKK